MLRELHIRDYALIEQLDLDFGPGFTVLTGETGAGKSIILDSLGLLIGHRAATEAIRTGAEVALVEGCFDLPDKPALLQYLQEAGIDCEDGTLIIAREVSRSGRSKCRINGRMATVSMLSDIGGHLIEMHGQHDNQELMKSESHVDWIDQLGGDGLSNLSANVAELYRMLLSKTGELDAIRQSERDRVQRLDLLRFQAEEIAKANLKPGEDEELAERRKFLQNMGKLLSSAQESHVLLSEGDESGSASVRDLLGRCIEALQTVVDFDSALREPLQALETAFYNVEEAGSTLRHYVDSVQADPSELNELEARLTVLNQLKRKYGDTITEILEYQSQIEKEIEDLANAEETAAHLDLEIQRIRQKLGTAASELSTRRRLVAAELSKNVESELAMLNMERARFIVSFGHHEGGQTVEVQGASVGVRATGIDLVEFLISANPGEDPKPLTKVASGGELSRVMLALKSILAQVDTVPTLIFDEVDTGIGGKTALSVAEKLAKLGQSKQVLCVTHLPQVAAAGIRHLLTEKTVGEDDRTRVAVTELPESRRLEELGRMLGGRQTHATLSHASELINLGQRWRNLTA